jgi:hypothetical protein
MDTQKIKRLIVIGKGIEGTEVKRQSGFAVMFHHSLVPVPKNSNRFRAQGTTHRWMIDRTFTASIADT